MYRETNKENPTADHRKVERFSIAVPARVEAENDSASDPHLDLFSRDVCSGGGFFLTSHPLDIGTRVKVRMLLCPRHMASAKGKKAQVTISGDVLRTDKDGMAVCFDRRYRISSVSE